MWVKPFVRKAQVVVMDNRLDAHFAIPATGSAIATPTWPATTLSATSRPEFLEIDLEKNQGQEPEEGVTAWGKAVGGLQAGLGYYPSQKRSFSHGETIRLIVRVRNVGTAELKFQYLRQFLVERPPIVTDADGKAVRQLWKLDAGGLGHVPEEVRLAPGKEIGKRLICSTNSGQRVGRKSSTRSSRSEPGTRQRRGRGEGSLSRIRRRRNLLRSSDTWR